jgi:predicted DNA-binding transcriptional regulator YafY
MAVNQKQFKRFEILHDLLSRGIPVRWTDIAKAYIAKNEGVTKKTVFNDIDRMKEVYDAPIKSEKGIYFYTKEFSLYKLFNIDDFQLAIELNSLFEQFAAFPQFKGLEEVRIKLNERVSSQSKASFVQFEQNDEYAGLKRLQEIYEAIKARKTLKIHFQDFSKSQKAYSISPYMLKEYHNRWHVYGYEHIKGKIYNLALDRILAIDEASIFPYREQKANDLAFLNDIIGFTYLYDAETETYAALETIKIKVDLPRANYIRTKPLHQSQQEISQETNQTHVVFTYQLRFNNELFAKLLEFGKDLEIIEPRHLREKMTVHIQEMAKKYGI